MKTILLETLFAILGFLVPARLTLLWLGKKIQPPERNTGFSMVIGTAFLCSGILDLFICGSFHKAIEASSPAEFISQAQFTGSYFLLHAGAVFVLLLFAGYLFPLFTGERILDTIRAGNKEKLAVWVVMVISIALISGTFIGEIAVWMIPFPSSPFQL